MSPLLLLLRKVNGMTMSHIENLRRLMSIVSENQTQQRRDLLRQIDSELSEIARLADHKDIGPLMLMLDDPEALDGIMFGIVHVIEALEDSQYVDEVVRNAASLWSRAGPK